MAAIANEVDNLLQSAVSRSVNLPNADILLTSMPLSFHANAAGVPDYDTMTVFATLAGLDGPVTWTGTGVTLTTPTANSVAVRFSDVTGTQPKVRASVTQNGTTYFRDLAVSVLRDGSSSTGADGKNFLQIRLYQWSPTLPAKPNGRSTFTWATLVNSDYTGTDSWTVGIPDNPNTPGLRLYLATVTISAAAGTVSTQVNYTGATVEGWVQNGTNGASGVQSASFMVYQWAATVPAGPAGTGQYTWATRAFGEAPGAWYINIAAAPSPGMVLWAATVSVVDSASNAKTAFSWTTATIMAVGYSPAAGSPGAEGASYVTAYCASATGATATAPSATNGRNSLPAANSGGLAGTYSATVPVLATGQYLYQTDGIYNPKTDQIIWSIPYWSSLKVGTLSAITANLGNITGGSINLGNGTFTVDNAGNLVCYSLKVIDPNTGKTVFQAGGKFNAEFLPNEALNSQLVPSIQAAATTSFIAGDGLNFEFDTDYMGWVGMNGATLAPGAGFITLSSANTDPMIVRTGLSFAGSQYDKVRMRIRRTLGSTGVGWDGTLFSNNEGVDAYVSIPNPNIGTDWQIIEWNMGSQAKWLAQTITRIRLDLGSTPQDKFDIDWIAIGKYAAGPSVGAVTAAAKTADWNGGLAGKPADSALLNSAVSLGDDGSLRGAGGGQVSLHGLGQDVLRVIADGGSSTTTPATAGLYLNGTLLYGSARSYNLAVIRRSDKAIVWHFDYDVYGFGAMGSQKTGGDLAYDLNRFANAPGAYIIVLWTADEPQANKMSAGLPDAMYRNGASRAVFGSPSFKYRSAYVLVAISGCGEGNGAEGYQGSIPSDAYAWVDMSFTIDKNGSLVVGNNYTPRSLVDYGYSGDLDATKGANSSNLNVGLGGRNLLDKNSLPNDASNYSTGYNGTGGDPVLYVNPSHPWAVFSPDGRGCVCMHVAGTPPVGSIGDLYRNPRVTVVPGQRYEAGVTISAHRVISRATISWFRADGSNIGEDPGNQIENYAWNTGNTEAPPRSTVIAKAPSDARTAMVYVRQTHNGGTDCYTFASQWYFSEALPAQTVPSPYSMNGTEGRDLAIAAQAALQNKIDATASSILRAPIAITTGGGVVVGSLTYDATNGLRGGGSGIAITPYGIIGHDGNKYTFGISGATGAAFFGGELQAAYGTFGALRIGAGGYIAQGSFSGDWGWPAVNSAPGFLIHPNGMLFGNRNDPNTGFFSVGANGAIEAPGLSYTGRQLRLDAPVIINPVLSPFNLSITNSQNQYNYTLYRASTDAYAGLYTASVDTGNSGTSFNWSVNGPWPCWLVQDSSSDRMQLHINMKGGASLAGDSGDFYINCAATKGGNTVNTQRLVTVTAS